MRSVHSPPPPAAAGEKPPGQRLDASPPLTGRSGPPAAPQRASRRAHTKARAGGRAGSAAPSRRADNDRAPAALRERPPLPGGGARAPQLPPRHQAQPLGREPQPFPGSRGNVALLAAVRRGRGAGRRGSRLSAAAGAAHRPHRAGPGRAEGGAASPHGAVLTGGGGGRPEGDPRGAPVLPPRFIFACPGRNTTSVPSRRDTVRAEGKDKFGDREKETGRVRRLAGIAAARQISCSPAVTFPWLSLGEGH